jgi:hypothetical protein
VHHRHQQLQRVQVGDQCLTGAGVLDLHCDRRAVEPDPEGLVSEPFTMRELRQLHEVVAGERLMPDSFRRLMERQLEDTGRTKEAVVVGRPVALERRKSSRSDS